MRLHLPDAHPPDREKSNVYKALFTQVGRPDGMIPDILGTTTDRYCTTTQRVSA
jgi:hypothetical protein